MSEETSNSRGKARYTLDEIGHVSADGGQFTITVDERFRPGLAGLAEFGHVVVTWWAHKANDLESHDPLIVEHPYVGGPSEVGVFATRTPLRPSPIGLSVSALDSVDETTGVVRLGWIDAIDQTPVLDIKPYFPASDRVRDARTPDWFSAWPSCLEDSAAFDWAAAFPEAI